MSAQTTRTQTARAHAVAPHSCVLQPSIKTTLSTSGKYGRLFPHLATQTADDAELLALGRSGAAMDLPAPQVVGDDSADPATDNPRIPAGWPIYGQLIAHDITADRSLLQHHTSVRQIVNFRTPRLDLECLYGAGPAGSPYMYDLSDSDKFLLGLNDACLPDDLPRNSQGIALIGDPRNDVHLPISQLHVAYLKFHNAIVDWLRGQGVAPADVFSEAQRLARWHHQWIALHEYLSLSAGEELVAETLRDGPRFYHAHEGAAFIPIEFSDAAYRFGHSQIRSSYRLNATATGALFPECLGMCPIPSARVIDWRYFFALDGGLPPQASKRIDTRLAHSLIALPDQIVGATDIPEHHSLAVRDLLRARALDMPSGEAVAEVIGAVPLTADELAAPVAATRHGTPLWYYVLREADVRHQGERLGPVGGRIVADVLVGLVDADAAGGAAGRLRHGRSATLRGRRVVVWRRGPRMKGETMMSATDVCTHLDEIRDVTPSANGCEECLKMGDTWVHLRMCLECGHVGCCDSSKNKHATKHFHATSHPIMQSFQPGEDWRWCYVDDMYV